MREALCRRYPKLTWVPRPNASVREQQAVCARCPVSSECLSFAMADPTIVGVWGGTTGGQRRKLRHMVEAA